MGRRCRPLTGRIRAGTPCHTNGPRTDYQAEPAQAPDLIVPYLGRATGLLFGLLEYRQRPVNGS
jgi:hypothetical protein